MSEGQVAGEHTSEGFRVVPCRRRVRGIREGDPVVLLPVEAVEADVTLLRLPTVRRMAAAGMRGCVLVPLSEWRVSRLLCILLLTLTATACASPLCYYRATPRDDRVAKSIIVRGPCDWRDGDTVSYPDETTEGSDIVFDLIRINDEEATRELAKEYEAPLAPDRVRWRSDN